MKSKKLLVTSLLALSLFMVTSCGQVNPENKPDGDDTNLPGGDDKPGEGENKPGEGDNKPGEGEQDKEPEEKFTPVSELIKIGEALENNTTTTEKYRCKGVIEKVTDVSKNAIIFKDDSGAIFCYRVNGKTTITPALKVGEELVLEGTVKKYNNKPQFNYPEIIKRDVVVEPPLQESECKAMTIEESRKAPIGTKVKVTGVVAIITKTQQFKDNGFYLVDNTGSIYVHSSSLVSEVKKGNKITILGQRENYLGSNESAAHKQGYLGAMQLTKPVLISNDNKLDNAFDESWIKENTIKNIIDTPLSTNITSEIYKVKTIVKKSSVNNNTILVLNDLDNKTGAIVYSCNKASDFEWLFPYDGKLVELYVAAHNVNVTDSSYNYRLEPIKVVQELKDYTLNDQEKADYVATYHVLNQFRKTYTSDPNLTLINTFTEDLWSIRNAKISYTSSNPSVIKIENNVMNCLTKGTSNIEIKVQVNEATVTKNIEIKFDKIDASNSLTVKEAIDTPKDTNVQVKGVVSSKVANKDAVYITDDSGTIAVSLNSADDLKDLHIGDEVVVKGTRDFKQKDPNKVGGQSNIYGSTILVNNYGNHQISEKSYVNSTLAELKAFTEDVDHTTTVYKIKVNVTSEKTAYSTNVNLVNGDNKLLLYSGSAADYSWLSAFTDKGEVTANVMLCDRNQKGLKGAVLSIEKDGVTTYNDVKLGQN